MKLEEFLREHPKKHIIFDFDETLVTLNVPWDKWRKEIRDTLANIDVEIVAKHDAGYAVPLINEMTKKYGKRIKDLVRPIMNHYENKYGDIKDINYTLINFIKKNKDNYSFYIWSSNMTVTVKRILRNLGIEKYFMVILGRDSVLLTKPELEGFFLIFDDSKHRKEDFVL